MPVVNKKAKSMSKEQLELIVSALEKNSDVSRNGAGRDFARDERKKKWAELASSLNALGGAVKTSKKWIKCWSDKKNDMKKKVNRIIEDRAKPGGPTSGERLTALERRIINLTGWSEQIRDEDLFEANAKMDCMKMTEIPTHDSNKSSCFNSPSKNVEASENSHSKLPPSAITVNSDQLKSSSLEREEERTIYFLAELCDKTIGDESSEKTEDEVRQILIEKGPDQVVVEELGNLTEVSAAVESIKPAESYNNAATIITLTPAMIQNIKPCETPATSTEATPATITDATPASITDATSASITDTAQASIPNTTPATVTRNLLFTKKRKRDEQSADSVVERTPTESLQQPQEHTDRKPCETAALNKIAAACEINNCKLQEQTVTLQQIAATMRKPEEASALNRIAAAFEINNCKMQEQTQTLQQLTATLTNEAVKQTLWLEKIYSTLNR
ncbi:uncharacterized protein LOC129220408 isoform X1 [Uloborus diversus]|uniref:uncharacterized protein LOC129220408 isoform X1 n=1 Tax=Uloborus diversus TaxID=327109 RepID=UPI0024095524|nr:uncharacterized protein LOC129220408 isoform X1 [Uloborus diversus]XP_054710800.1 uncharacterized protein LOC129220408 isoform X1 [Uloborus diversus]XP_054710801.1 uncharacterized protein LOC129220408 isoform X1 [Uloborus diversus]